MTSPISLPSSNMTDFALEVGQCFRYDTIVFKIESEFGSKFILKNTISLESRNIDRSALIAGLLSGNIIPCSATEISRAMNGDAFLEDDLPHVIKGSVQFMSEAARAHGHRLIKYISVVE